MLEAAVSPEFIERIDPSQRSAIAKLVGEERTFIAPALSSFSMRDLGDEDTRAWTYSANSR